MGWVNELQTTASAGFTALESDAQKLEALNTEASSLLSILRSNTSKLDAELREEQAFEDALAQDDPEYLDELKATIGEQEAVLQAFRDEKADNDSAIEALEKRIAELELSNQAERDAIALLERPEEPVKDVIASDLRQGMLNKPAYIHGMHQTHCASRFLGGWSRTVFCCPAPAIRASGRLRSEQRDVCART